MFEYHGWVTVRDSTDESDDDALHRIASEIESRCKDLDEGYDLIDFRWVNGSPYVHVGGSPNHRGSAEAVVEFFRWIAAAAPGSYGLLHYWDDEDPRGEEARNQFRVLVMKRGTVTEQSDGFLSPCMPTIEDPVTFDDD